MNELLQNNMELVGPIKNLWEKFTTGDALISPRAWYSQLPYKGQGSQPWSPYSYMIVWGPSYYLCCKQHGYLVAAPFSFTNKIVHSHGHY
jgi:hypothetical protein